MKKRIVIVAVLVILVAGIGGLLYFSYDQVKPPVFNSMSVSEEMSEDQTILLDDFIFQWHGEEGRLVVYHARMDDHIIFSTPAGQGFLAAGVGKMESEESRGYFQIDEQRVELYDRQTVAGVFEEENRLVIEGRLENDAGEAVPYRFILSPVSEYQLHYRVLLENPQINRTYLSWAVKPAEHFFGFGTQYSSFDMRGRSLPVLVQEQGIGRGAQPLTFLADLTHGAGGTWYHTYAPVPHFISSELRSLFSENKEYQVFHLPEGEKAQLEVFSSEAQGRIYAGESPAELLREHTGVVGRMRPLPRWTQQGLILGAQGGTEAVEEKLTALLEQDVPVTGLWIQDWVGRRKTSFGKQLWWNWELDRDHYSGWDGFKRRLDAEDIRLLGYVNPFLVYAEDKGNVRNDWYSEAEGEGYFVKDEEGETIEFLLTDFTAGLLDLTIPEAREWIKAIIIAEMVDNGFYGWMADFGEALPLDVQMAGGKSGLSYHNHYPEEWSKINREVLAEAGLEEEGMFFVRAGFSESPAYVGAFWLGDQNVTWDEHDGIKTAVTGLLTSGLSGFSLNHSDIGGYTSITDFPLNYVRSEELLLRWIELNAFTAVFRSHEGNRPDENLQIYSNDRIIGHVKEFASIYRALAPYREKLMEEAYRTGAPVVRPMFFHYPHDPVTYKINYEQFMLGEDMIVAPVLDKGKEAVSLYLPEGRWVHHFSGEIFEIASDGEHVEVPAPLGEPGVFYRPGSRAEDLLGG